MREWTTGIGLAQERRNSLVADRCGLIFRAVGDHTGKETKGYLVEKLDGTELPTETRFIFLYYNRSSGKWTEEQDLQYDDGNSDNGGIDEDKDYDQEGEDG